MVGGGGYGARRGLWVAVWSKVGCSPTRQATQTSRYIFAQFFNIREWLARKAHETPEIFKGSEGAPSFLKAIKCVYTGCKFGMKPNREHGEQWESRIRYT